MTNIEMLFGRPKADGTLAPAVGSLTWTPTLRHAAEGTPDAVVLPLPFTIAPPLEVDGVKATTPVPFTISVEPNTPAWVWKVEENFAGSRRRRFYVTVPDALSVDYNDLPLVDPATLLPGATPSPAWYAYTDGLALAATESKAAALAAQSAATTAQGSAAASAATATDKAATATQKATDAGLSATAAASSATAAASSASAAFDRATSADGSKTAAATSATNAASSATGAATSAGNAATSATAAGTAKTAAETARDAAVAARDTASGHKDTASAAATSAGNSAAAANTSAVNAATSAGSASTSAGTATTKAATATTKAAEAAASADQASTSAFTASNAATTATGARDTAVTAKNQAVAAADGFSMGTVSTLGPTEPATATISGVAPNRVISLAIPRGVTPNVQIGTVNTVLPQANPGPTGSGGPQGIQGVPGDMVTVAGPGVATGTITLVTGDLPSTRIWSLTGNVTLVLPTPGATKSGTITLVLTQDATGNRTITWPAGVKWPDGIAQQPAAAANTTSVIHLLWTGTAWLGLVGGKSFA